MFTSEAVGRASAADLRRALCGGLSAAGDMLRAKTGAGDNIVAVASGKRNGLLCWN